MYGIIKTESKKWCLRINSLTALILACANPTFEPYILDRLSFSSRLSKLPER